MSSKISTLSSVIKRFSICNVFEENKTLAASNESGDIFLKVSNFYEGKLENTVSYNVEDISKKISGLKPESIVIKNNFMEFEYKKNSVKSKIMQVEIKRDLGSIIENAEPEDPVIFFIEKRHIDKILSIPCFKASHSGDFGDKLEMFSEKEGRIIFSRTDGVCCFSKFEMEIEFKNWKPFRVWNNVEPFKIIQSWDDVEFRTDGNKHRLSQDGVSLYFRSVGTEKISLLEKCNFNSLKSNIKNSEKIDIEKKVLSDAISDFKKISDFKNIKLIINNNSILLKSRMLETDSMGVDEVIIESKSSVEAELNMLMSMMDLMMNCVSSDASKKINISIAPFRDGCYMIFVDSGTENNSTEVLIISTK